VLVTGARCDTSGRVVNRPGAGDAQVSTAKGTTQRDPDGSGQFSNGYVTYQVDADGSGQAFAGDAGLQVDADGSGQYSDGGLTYQVDSDGSGQYSTGDETYQVDSDGSGQWSIGSVTVQNNGDGTGTYDDGSVVIDVNGDGTGIRDGEPVKVAPMAKFALLGKLPKLQLLRPIGRPCGTLVRIDARLLFDFDRATLRPEGTALVRRLAPALRRVTGAVQVNGHTDAKGSDAYNLDLSQRRAAAVEQALLAAGVTAPLTVHGYGESQPVAPNTVSGKDNPAGRQLNRRVELVIP
jgi:OOP family OmpA-OmpF porin